MPGAARFRAANFLSTDGMASSVYTILIAVDGSEHANHATDAVARLPRGADGTAVVLAK